VNQDVHLFLIEVHIVTGKKNGILRGAKFGKCHKSKSSPLWCCTLIMSESATISEESTFTLLPVQMSDGACEDVVKDVLEDVVKDVLDGRINASRSRTQSTVPELPHRPELTNACSHLWIPDLAPPSPPTTPPVSPRNSKGWTLTPGTILGTVVGLFRTDSGKGDGVCIQKTMEGIEQELADSEKRLTELERDMDSLMQFGDMGHDGGDDIVVWTKDYLKIARTLPLQVCVCVFVYVSACV
jgi:hypothetical protein